MAARRKVTRKRKDQVVEETTTPVLDELELEIGTQVRFKRNENESWTTGKVMGDSKDGSITLIDNDGKWRNFLPEHIQIKTQGPRGGVRWIGLIDAS